MRKKEKIKLLFILILGLISAGASAQSAKTLIRKGNKLYEQKKYSEAEVQYRKAQVKSPKYEKSTFNLGDAVYQEKNYKGAENFFKNLVQKTKSPVYKANAWYNLGNTFMQQKQYEKSIGSYIRSLKHQPADMDAKYNLVYARKMLKKQKQQKKKQKQNKKNKNKNKKNKNQNKKKNQNKNKQKPQNQQGNQKKNSQKKQQHISPQEAQRILNALKNNEKNTLKKLERAKAKAKAAKAKTNVINW